MSLPQTILIPQQLTKHEDFLLKISQNNQQIYSHIEYLKHLVENIYQMYRKMSKSIIKLTEEYEKKLSKQNDSTALSIINFIKGIQKLFLNIKEQICNNTVNMNKKNQKVSKTRKDIIHQKLTKIHQLFLVYLQKVSKYNTYYKQYENKCSYFKDIEKDVIKFYSMKENKVQFQELKQKQTEIQQQLQETYSLKIELNTGLCEIRLSLKQFFEMLSNNAEDDKKLLMSVRKRIKETKIFNQTIIEQVNSQAEQSVMPSNQQRHAHHFGNPNSHRNRMSSSGGSDHPNEQHNNQNQKLQFKINDSIREQQDKINKIHQDLTQQTQYTFFSVNKNISVSKDVKQLGINLHSEQYCVETFCQFIQCFEKEIIQNAQVIDKLRNTEDFQKFINKKFQINQLLTSDMVYNIEAIKNQIADIRQIIENVKALLDKKKVIYQLKKYRSMRSQKFLSESQLFIDQQKKYQNQEKELLELKLKYKEQKQKYAKGHLELMHRFRQMVQDLLKQINQKFKFQRNPEFDSKKVKNQFIQKKYFALLTLNFFLNKQEAPKFQMNTYMKNYEKYLSEENLKKVGLSTTQEQTGQNVGQKGWGCCGVFSSQKKKSLKNKYIDEYNCALRQGIVLIQGKMKIHPNYFKFISSFNAKTLFGETNLRIPKSDIVSIEKQYYLLSLVIVVNTIRGSLPFTSFLTDPYKKLTNVYENKQPARKPVIISNKKINSTGNNQEVQNVITSPFNIEQNQADKQQTETFTVNTNMVNFGNKSKKNTKIFYMNELQEKFQSEIPQLIDKQEVSFESLSTYLSENKKQLSISVQYHLKDNLERRYFFEIKVMDQDGKLEYKFVHQKAMQDKLIKKLLQEMATTIINTNIQPRTPRTPKTPKQDKNKKTKNINQLDKQREKQFLKKDQNLSKCSFFNDCPINKLFENSSYSFIQRRQNNQFQFDKDPSFVYVKQPSVAHNNEQPSFNYVPDLQIFKNMNSDRKLPFSQHYQNNKQTEQSFASSKKSKNQSRSISKEDIDEYLNSIDQSTIKKNLFTKKDLSNNKTLKKQTLLKSPTKQVRGQQTRIKKSQQQGYLSVNMLVIVLIVILLMNVMVSLFK